MSLISQFRIISEGEKTRVVRSLIEQATPDFNFSYLTVLSVLMASFGLLAGNETIVIGSMLIAPLMSPVLALALGLAMSNHALMMRSITTLVRSTALAILAAVGAALLFSFGSFGAGEITDNLTILSRTEPTLLYFAVAVIAGLAVVYTMAREGLSETLPGVAVAVALVPPLAVIGIGIAHLSLTIAIGALVMYLVNVAGIVFAAMLSFSLMDVHDKREQAEQKMAQENLRVEREQQKVAAIEQVAKTKAVTTDTDTATTATNE